MAVGPLIPGSDVDRARSPLEIEGGAATRAELAGLARAEIRRKNSPLAQLSDRLRYRDCPALLAMASSLSEPLAESIAKISQPGLGTGEETQDPYYGSKPAND